MRDGATYRGAKKLEAREKRLDWKRLDKIKDSAGTVVVKYPFERLGRKV